MALKKDNSIPQGLKTINLVIYQTDIRFSMLRDLQSDSQVTTKRLRGQKRHCSSLASPYRESLSSLRDAYYCLTTLQRQHVSSGDAKIHGFYEINQYFAGYLCTTNIYKVSIFDKRILTVIVNAEGSANLDIVDFFLLTEKRLK